MAECRSCGAPIVWVMIAKSGKKMPVDRDPVADGNIRLLATSHSDGTPLVAYVKRDDLETLPHERHVSHFATCPNAAEHRR